MESKPLRGRPSLPDDKKATSNIHFRVKRVRKAAYVAAANREKKTLVQWATDHLDTASGLDESAG